MVCVRVGVTVRVSNVLGLGLRMSLGSGLGLGYM